MAYIDVDKFAEKICNFQAIDEDAANKMIWLLRTFPSADVVPKSEVEKLTVELEAMRTAANSYKMHYEKTISEVERLEHILDSYALQYGTVTEQQEVIDKAKAEVAREIFEGIDNFLIKTVGEFDKALDKAAREDKYGLAHLYSDERNLVITLKIAIAELKKKYTEGKQNER